MLLNQIESSTRLDPRVRRTRSLLLQAFRELLAEKGFSTLTVQDIATQAQVNRATFYAHFEDKFDLLDYSVREQLQEMLHQSLPDGAKFTPANLRVIIVTITGFVGGFAGSCHPHAHSELQMRAGVQVERYIYELLLSWLIDNKEREEDHAATIAAGISWLIFGTVFQSVTTRTKQSPDQLADTIITFLEPSLSDYFAV